MIIDFFRNHSNQQSVSNNSLEERFHSHPQLKTRVEALLNLVENAEHNIEKVNVAEQKVIEEVRQMGQEVLEDWAIQQAVRIAKEFQTAHPVAKKHEKTLLA